MKHDGNWLSRNIEALREAMEKCQSLNLDLVRGDIVEFDQSHGYQYYHAIYNGQKLEETGYFTEGDGYLEEDYKIIEDDVPLNYWFEFNESIHFNMALVLDQCIENLKFGDDQWRTHFVYHGENYKIVLSLGHNLNKRDNLTLDEMKFVLKDTVQNEQYDIDHDDEVCLDYYTIDMSLNPYYYNEEDIVQANQPMININLLYPDYDESKRLTYVSVPIVELPGLYRLQRIDNI